ncbi:MAG: glycoside hydrolase family 15 [Sporichthyaceae bacterium]
MPRRERSARRSFAVPMFVAAAVAIAGFTAVEGEAAAPAEQRLLSAGLSGSADPVAFARRVLPATTAGRYVPNSSVLESSGAAASAWLVDSWSARRDPADPRGISWARTWLRAGEVPGRTTAERAVARRALLDLALLTEPNGASVANPFGPWNYAWPRDAAWHAAAFAVTGHGADALRVLRFFAGVQDRDGTWAARYRSDGSPVRDGRARQLDAVGWLPWAAWLWWRAGGAQADLRGLWPMVAAAANAAAASLRPGGLPRASADYTEQRESRHTLGTAAPLLLGLRASVELANELGEQSQARRWTEAARRLDRAIVREFGSTGYRRYPSAGAGPDSAIAFLTSPLAVPAGERTYPRAVRVAEELLMPSGGLRPGNMRGVRHHTFTPATALFALAAAGAGDEAGFRRWYDWLVAHRTSFEAFPEKVTNAGAPAAVAPLGWTCSIVLVALAARDGRVQSPPAP